MTTENSLFFAGIDVGSTMTKVVVAGMDGEILSRVVGPTGAEHRRLANLVMEEALAKANLPFDRISYVIATGYGRINVPFADRQVTELTCHSKGIVSLFPNVRTAIDIGGQDAKGLKIRDGKLVDFVMNDRCAAGTGRFLEVIADSLSLKLDDLGSLSLKSTRKLSISNTCTVFARVEVASRLSEGEAIEDIVAGIHDAIANRVVKMAQRLGIEPDIVLTGGVAKNIGMVRAMEDNLKHKVLVPPEPLLTGALGAALLGKDFVQKAAASGQTLPIKPRKLEEARFFT
ncbi:MAG: 2-hydroxyglutaryl-CoA dehydratase [Chloroflexi bacterium]|nr:2-hydroxyglutaryl-CoA dehydratase [Chloroflexota bacterium]